MISCLIISGNGNRLSRPNATQPLILCKFYLKILSYAIIEHLVAPIELFPLDNYSILEIKLAKRDMISKLFPSHHTYGPQAHSVCYISHTQPFVSHQSLYLPNPPLRSNSYPFNHYSIIVVLNFHRLRSLHNDGPHSTIYSCNCPCGL